MSTYVLIGLVVVAAAAILLIVLWPRIDTTASTTKSAAPIASSLVSAQGAGPVDVAGDFPATALLAFPGNFDEILGSRQCDPSLVKAVYGLCTANLVDSDDLIDRLNAESGASPLPIGAKNLLRRRLFTTAAHCTRPFFHWEFLSKDGFKQVDGNGYFDLPGVYPFDDPAVSASLGFNVDMGFSPGRVRFYQVAGAAQCARNFSSNVTVQFNSASGYPMYDLWTLAVGGIPPGGWQATVIIKDNLAVDNALYLLKDPAGVPESVVPDWALQRVYLSNGFDDPTKFTAPSFTVAGYGVVPSGSVDLNYLGNPMVVAPYPNNTAGFRKVETDISTTLVTDDSLRLNWVLANGQLGICNGDSGSSSLRFNATDGHWYTYAVTSLGGSFCRNTAYMARIGTPNWRKWVRDVVTAYMTSGLDDGQGNGSQHIRLLSAVDYKTQYGSN